jgi:anaerobic selenocysteine-containing dehydrogenase
MNEVNRRGFLKGAGVGITAAGLSLVPGAPAAASAAVMKDNEKHARKAACSLPIR